MSEARRHVPGETMKSRESDMNRMKRLLIMIIVLTAALLAGNAGAQGTDQVAFILSINGTVESRQTANAEWITAKVKDPLFNGTQLRTGTGDKAIVIYPGSGSRVLVNENTTIEIHAEGAGNGAKPTVERTRLMVGEIYNQAHGNYQVETPSSVASVRGTAFDARSTPENDTFIGVEGVIEIMNQFGSVILNPLQMSMVQQNQAPGQPTNLTQDDTQRLVRWTEGVEPTWRLNMVPENGPDQNLNGTFLLSIFAYRDGVIDQNANFRLTEFTASSQGIGFSTDDGKTWTAAPPAVTLVNGQAALRCRVTQEGTVTLTAAAVDAETGTMNIAVSTPKERRVIELRFTDPDGSGERTMEWELEEK